MKFAHRIVSAAVLGLWVASSSATTTVYTSAATFLPLLAAGSYTETFNGLSDAPAGGVFSGGAFQYAISSSGGLYASGAFLGTNLPNAALAISFTGGTVNAIGANFYATNISDVFQPVAMTITLSDGTAQSFTPTSPTASYRGFVSDLAITSLVISAPGPSLYAGLDNLTVGRALAVVPAVPEPTTWALMGLGLAGLAVARRRA